MTKFSQIGKCHIVRRGRGNSGLEMMGTCRQAKFLRGRPTLKDFWSIFIPIFKDFSMKKPVELPRNKISFQIYSMKEELPATIFKS